MDFRLITIVVMLTTSTSLIVWDVYVAFFNKVSNNIDTVSGIMQGWYRRGMWPLAFAFGVVGGHLFMPGVLFTKVHWAGLLFLVMSAGLLGVAGWKLTPLISQVRWRVALRAFGLINLGLAEGWIFWPQ